MRRFAVLVIASVLAPALMSAAVHTRPVIDIATLPGVIDIDFGNLPGILDEPVLKPHPMPEHQPLPEIIDVNPCNACFEYMTSLIDQLTVGNVVPVLPELPTVSHPEEEAPVRPIPEGLPENIRPLPLPVAPEIEINPIPMPVAPEAGIRPLPVPVAPEIEIQPIPLPIPPLFVSSELLPEDH